MGSAVIVDIVRTASGRGKPGGALSGAHPVRLLSAMLVALIERTGLDPALVDDVIAGCVSQVGDQAANIGRIAALTAGFPESVPATSVDRQCGSSQQALPFAAQGVTAGASDIAIAGGVESMSRVPMGMSSKCGRPYGLVADRSPHGLVNQGVSAEIIASRWKLDRAELDEYSERSHQRAAAAAVSGGFGNEIIPIEVTAEDGTTSMHARDETVRGSTTIDGLAALKPSFYDESVAARFPEPGWVITPCNSSPLTDGPSPALVLNDDQARNRSHAP